VLSGEINDDRALLRALFQRRFVPRLGTEQIRSRPYGIMLPLLFAFCEPEKFAAKRRCYMGIARTDGATEVSAGNSRCRRRMPNRYKPYRCGKVDQYSRHPNPQLPQVRHSISDLDLSSVNPLRFTKLDGDCVPTLL
jgi:hypothetical protein